MALAMGSFICSNEMNFRTLLKEYVPADST